MVPSCHNSTNVIIVTKPWLNNEILKLKISMYKKTIKTLNIVKKKPFLGTNVSI